MMDADIDGTARGQLDALVRGVQKLLGDDLIGIYLHGSLAMGCFNPTRSDIDMLVVTVRPMNVETKRQAVVLLSRLSGAPSPIEISFLRHEDLNPWRCPPPFDLHFSESWRERYERDLASGEWERWNAPDEPPTDLDLAAHVTITRRRGRCLAGLPIEQVFPRVPAEDYRAAILDDFTWLKERSAENSVYAVLNSCRVLWYCREGRISSKAEAGEWASQALSEEFRSLVADALAGYRGPGDELLENEDVLRFLDWVQLVLARDDGLNLGSGLT